ncbi:hypothetical protein Ciccas_009243 [Cichlidogyrus casuarinus]|uniref:Uncharacterized protein n=1 Tax=Cichlidogyrus casuarinus TaxID=1844966 RepID=A0ABD2PXL3_9PLAT
MDNWLKDQMLRLEALHETMVLEAHDEYSKEIEACDKDLDSEKKRVQDILFSICEDLKARMEEDKRNIELTTSGDVLEAKPQSTRKLRRRGQYGNNLTTNNNSATLLSEVIFNSSRWNGKALLSPRSQQLHSGDETEPTEVHVEQCHSYYTEQDKCGSSIFGSLSLNLTDETLLPTLVVSLKNQGSITMATILNDAATQDNCNWVSRYPFLSLAANSSSSNGSGLNGFSGSAGPSLAGISNKKRRLNPNSSQAQLNLQLNENDIYADLNLIHRAGGKGGNSAMNTRKQYQTHQLQQQTHGSECSPESLFPFHRGQSGDSFVTSPLYPSIHDSSDLKPESGTTSSVWIDDGRLYYKQKWYSSI